MRPHVRPTLPRARTSLLAAANVEEARALYENGWTYLDVRSEFELDESGKIKVRGAARRPVTRPCGALRLRRRVLAPAGRGLRMRNKYFRSTEQAHAPVWKQIWRPELKATTLRHILTLVVC